MGRNEGVMDVMDVMEMWRGLRAWAYRAGRLGAIGLAVGGCPAEDEEPPPDTGAEDASTDADSDAGTEASGGDVPWSGVECETETCMGSDFCFQPASYCSGPCVDNYRDLVTPPRRCEPLPESCDPENPASCLYQELCDLGEGSFYDGQLRCFDSADCYCE